MKLTCKIIVCCDRQEELEKEGISKDPTKRIPLKIEKKGQPQMRNILSTKRLKGTKETHTETEESGSPRLVHRPRSQSDSSHKDLQQIDKEGDDSTISVTNAAVVSSKLKKETSLNQSKNTTSPKIQFINVVSVDFPEESKSKKLKDRKENKEDKSNLKEDRSENTNSHCNDNGNNTNIKGEQEVPASSTHLKNLSKGISVADLHQLAKDKQKKMNPYKRQAVDRQNTRIKKVKSKDEVITKNITENNTRNETSKSQTEKSALKPTRSAPSLTKLSHTSSSLVSSDSTSSTGSSVPTPDSLSPLPVLPPPPPPLVSLPTDTSQTSLSPVLPPPPPPLPLPMSEQVSNSGTPKTSNISKSSLQITPKSPTSPKESSLQASVKTTNTQPKVPPISKAKSGTLITQQKQPSPPPQPPLSSPKPRIQAPPPNTISSSTSLSSTSPPRTALSNQTSNTSAPHNISAPKKGQLVKSSSQPLRNETLVIKEVMSFFVFLTFEQKKTSIIFLEIK